MRSDDNACCVGVVGAACSMHGREKRFIHTLVGKSEGKKSLEKPKRRRENDSEVELQEKRWECVNWINLIPRRVQMEGFCEHGNKLESSKRVSNFLTI